MNVEALLLLVILGLGALLGWKEREGRLERNKLINALLAKNAQELRDLDLVEKVAPIRPEQVVNTGAPDYIPENEIDDEAFLKMAEEGRLNG